MAEEQDEGLDLGFVAPAGTTGTTGEDADVLGQLLDSADDPDSQREELSDQDLRSLDLEFQDVARLDAQVKEAEQVVKRLKQRRDDAKARMLEAMELQGTSQFRSGEGLGSCYVQERFDTVVEDEEAFRAYVMEHAPHLLSVHSQTRNRFIREEYRDRGVDPESDEFPPGIVVKPRRMLAVRGAKAKK